jgi:hypothetical protein
MYSLFLDWSSRRHGVLYTIAGNETGSSFGFCVPTDTFNGLVVGATTTHDGTMTGIFDRIANFNVVHQLPNGGGQFGRRTIDIVAPGDNLEAVGYGNFGIQPVANGNGSGTSFAAPHVAGAVAILNERMINNPNIGANAFRPEVTKAILMNSADKIQGVLDMDKTILRGPVATNNSGGLTTDLPLDWVQARNADDFANPVPPGQTRFRELVPLDSQLGVGQLNVLRAVKQLDGLEQKPGFVSAIGWDSNTIGPMMSPTQFRVYHLPTLPSTNYVSATLVWQRQVNLVETLTTDGPNPVPVAVDGEFSAEAYLKMGVTVPTVGGPFAAGDPLIDLNGNGVYDARMTESFSTVHGAQHSVPGLSDLDLYLLPRGWNNLGQAIAKSISTIYSVEHIFEMVPGGQYDLVVFGFATVGSVPQDYGLAWWTVPEPGTGLVIVVFALVALRRRTAIAA